MSEHLTASACNKSRNLIFREVPAFVVGILLLRGSGFLYDRNLAILKHIPVDLINIADLISDRCQEDNVPEDPFTKPWSTVDTAIQGFCMDWSLLVLKLLSGRSSSIDQNIDTAQIPVSFIGDHRDRESHFCCCSHSVFTGTFDHILRIVPCFRFACSHVRLDESRAHGNHADPFLCVFMGAFCRVPHNESLAQCVSKSGFIFIAWRTIHSTRAALRRRSSSCTAPFSRPFCSASH